MGDILVYLLFGLAVGCLALIAYGVLRVFAGVAALVTGPTDHVGRLLALVVLLLALGLAGSQGIHVIH